MRLIDRIAFTGAAVTGLALLAFGIWVFAISLVPAPVTMVSGGVLLVLTAIAWRQHRAALTDGLSENNFVSNVTIARAISSCFRQPRGKQK